MVGCPRGPRIHRVSLAGAEMYAAVQAMQKNEQQYRADGRRHVIPTQTPRAFVNLRLAARHAQITRYGLLQLLESLLLLSLNRFRRRLLDPRRYYKPCMALVHWRPQYRRHEAVGVMQDFCYEQRPGLPTRHLSYCFGLTTGGVYGELGSLEPAHSTKQNDGTEHFDARP